MNRDPGEDGNSLFEIVEAQIACTARLVDVLDAERVALLTNDLDGLEMACSGKSMGAQHLQQLGARMSAKTGGAGSRLEIEAFLRRQEGGRNLLNRWADLGRLAALCNDSNRSNGALLEVREQQVRGALAALQPEAPAIYGRHGGSRPRLPSQIISRA